MEKGNDTMLFLGNNNDTLFDFIYPATTTEINISLYHPCDPDPGNEDFNCTVELFLTFNRGPQQMPLITAVMVTIFFLGIFVTGVIGNLIVCLVIIKHDSMHTATNYYLFSLAVSDLIFLLFGLPYDLSLYWHQYPYNLGLGFCKIRALISEASTYVSVLTIVAFSMERFLAICHPLHLYTMSGLQRAIRIIVGLWLISFLSAVPFALFTDIDYLNYPPTNEKLMDSAFCAMLEYPSFPLWELSTCLFFVFPMVVMIVLYGKMGLRIRSRTRHSAQLGVQHGSMYNESRQSQSRKAIIRMLAAVVITFFVCWAPFHAQRLLYLYARNWQHFNIVNTWLFSVAGWLYYVSCTINPILYNVMSNRYRVAFKETLCGRKKSRAFTNGFSRDQSSFRETVIGGVGLAVNTGGNAGENTKLLRVSSVMTTKHPRLKDRIHSSSLRWHHGTGITNGNRSICTENLLKNQDTSIGAKQHQSIQSPTINTHSNVVVVLGNDVNGTKYYTTTTGTTTTTTNLPSPVNPTITITNFESSNLTESEHNNNSNNRKKYETCI